METVSIIGLGLVGGSLGLALKKYRPEVQVKGYSRKKETIATALVKKAIDVPAATLPDAVKDARLVVIATPVLTIERILKDIAPCVGGKCIISDTGSTKAAVMQWARESLPAGAEFVGGHPMAGKERSGIEFAEADLFRDCTYCLTPPDGASKEAVAYLKSMATAIGARPFVLEAVEHDRLVARISHLPFVLSVALMDLCARDPSWGEAAKLAGSGFRDMTRLAAGDPEMYRDICLTNLSAIQDFLDKYISHLKQLKYSLADADRLGPLFQFTRQAREDWMKGR